MAGYDWQGKAAKKGRFIVTRALAARQHGIAAWQRPFCSSLVQYAHPSPGQAARNHKVNWRNKLRHAPTNDTDNKSCTDAPGMRMALQNRRDPTHMQRMQSTSAGSRTLLADPHCKRTTEENGEHGEILEKMPEKTEEQSIGHEPLDLPHAFPAYPGLPRAPCFSPWFLSLMGISELCRKSSAHFAASGIGNRPCVCPTDLFQVRCTHSPA